MEDTLGIILGYCQILINLFDYLFFLVFFRGYRVRCCLGMDEEKLERERERQLFCVGLAGSLENG